MTKVLIVKTGTTVPEVRARRGDFEAWITRGMGLSEADAEVADVYLGAPLPNPGGFDGVVVTGSAALVTDRDAWSVQTGAWLAEAAGGATPILGICYGHQLLADALGGEVANNPRGRQIGTTDLTPGPEAEGDPLLGGLERPLHVPLTHMQSVLRLPRGATLLGGTAGDPHHAFRIGERVWGVQCHPEFDADIVRGYIAARRDQIASEGLNPDQLAAAARDTPDGDLLLRRFCKFIQ